MIDGYKRLKQLMNEIKEDGIDFEIIEHEEDSFIVSFIPEYDSMDLFGFMNASACDISNNPEFKILDQNNSDNNFVIKVLPKEQ